jgi:hypothetical protein
MGYISKLPFLCRVANDEWYAWDGCGCIAGAMVEGYWHSHGYPNISDDDDTLIDINHHFMWTTDGG